MEPVTVTIWNKIPLTVNSNDFPQTYQDDREEFLKNMFLSIALTTQNSSGISTQQNIDNINQILYKSKISDIFIMGENSFTIQCNLTIGNGTYPIETIPLEKIKIWFGYIEENMQNENNTLTKNFIPAQEIGEIDCSGLPSSITEEIGRTSTMANVTIPINTNYILGYQVFWEEQDSSNKNKNEYFYYSTAKNVYGCPYNKNNVVKITTDNETSKKIIAFQAPVNVAEENFKIEYPKGAPAVNAVDGQYLTYKIEKPTQRNLNEIEYYTYKFYIQPNNTESEDDRFLLSIININFLTLNNINLHLAPYSTGGIALGKISTSEKNNPKFECEYPIFYKNLKFGFFPGDKFKVVGEWPGRMGSGVLTASFTFNLGQPIFSSSLSWEGKIYIDSVNGYINYFSDTKRRRVTSDNTYKYTKSTIQILDYKIGILQLKLQIYDKNQNQIKFEYSSENNTSEAQHSSPLILFSDATDPLIITFN